MIYTLTVNPSIDYHMVLDRELTVGSVNRARQEMVYPGGKGINVSIMLGRLDVRSVALGFLGGRTGEMLTSLCSDLGCRSDFIFLPEGETRINVKVDGTRRETAINGQGPAIPADSVGELIDKLQILMEVDTLVVSGSFPKDDLSVCEAIYEAAVSRGARLVVDTSGEALRKSLAYKPFLIKPNEEELCDLFESIVTSERKLEELMSHAKAMGARNVLLSRGAGGAILMTEDDRVFVAKLKQHREPVSTVGAGDSMQAGFLASLENSRMKEKQTDTARRPDDETLMAALRLGCAAGTATAMTSWLADREAVTAMKAFVECEK